MKTDRNGCSTCPTGEERYEEFTSRKGMKFIQYEYRHANGELFSCVGKTLEQCRDARNKWLLTVATDTDYEIRPKGCENCDNNAGLTIEAMHDIVDEFFANGFAVKLDAIKHNYEAWCSDKKSGFKDEENDVFLFTPCGCNQLRFTASHLTGAEWEETYAV